MYKQAAGLYKGDSGDPPRRKSLYRFLPTLYIRPSGMYIRREKLYRFLRRESPRRRGYTGWSDFYTA